MSRAQIALAWLRSKPVVTAPIVGANKTTQIDDAVASLDIDLTPAEIAALERPYTPRYDFQGISDEAEMQRSETKFPGTPTHDAQPLPEISRRMPSRPDVEFQV